MEKYCIWEVGKGNQIEIWNDTWLPDLTKPVALNNQVSTITHQKVEALISPATGNWNQSVLNANFDQHTVDSINSIRIPLNGSDQIKWSLSKEATISWFVWKSRCSEMFQGDCSTPLQTAQEAILMIQNQNRVLTSSPNSTLTNTNRITCWRPPSSQALKLNIDASFLSSTVFAGIGILIRDNADSFKAANCIQLRASSSKHAEGLALLAAVEWARDLNLTRVIFESDAQSVINYINHETGILDWRCKIILKDCKTIILSFEFVEFTYTIREFNRPADTLAKAARLSTTGSAVFEVPPSFIFDHLSNDVNGIINIIVPLSDIDVTNSTFPSNL
ncbi:Ribonuclease H domain [Macleaya cordata]|uniref:Ribonuclease H domain n=1 Tax=Macleaya cordata TaxID=56857 RepID=A0A200PYF3_MACCD|nr:Ribonuclease H domain [Macleaya cordata]